MPVDAERLREQIRKVYSEVVRDPKRGYHFHTVPEYAVERLGYPAQALAELPDSVTAPFAGVGNPLAMGEPRPGETVVDIGAGSGMDSLLAARAVGPTGRVIVGEHSSRRVEKRRHRLCLQLRKIPDPIPPRPKRSPDSC